MELIYISRSIALLAVIIAYFVWKYRKPLEDGTFRRIFKFRGTTYGFTYTADEIEQYSISSPEDRSEREYWHQIWLGLYRKKEY